MTYISPHQSSADNVQFSAAAEQASAQHSSTPATELRRAGASHLPGPVAGQGASRHPLQISETRIDQRVPFYSLPIELRNKIAEGLDVATKLNLKLTCRQAYAEGNQLHFDISVSNGNELDDALAFFGQSKGKLHSLDITPQGTTDTIWSNVSALGRFRSGAAATFDPPSVTATIDIKLSQLQRLQEKPFSSLRSLTLSGGRLADKGADVPQQVATLLSSLPLKHIRLVNNDWLEATHLDQLCKGGIRSFSLQGNSRLTTRDIAQLAERANVKIDVAADAEELALRRDAIRHAIESSPTAQLQVRSYVMASQLVG